jgi:O-succinylbenzoate synthase
LENRPLHEILGGEYKKVQVGADFGVQDTIDKLLELIGKAVSEGFPRIKLKAKPGWDIDMLEAVRSTFPKQTFHIDCNSGYSIEDLPLFKKIDKLGLAMIEQPLFHTDIVDHAKFAKELETPICLDESINSPFAARQAIEIGACRFINLKTGRLGGLQNCLDVNRMCEEAGIGCWVGGMLETSVGGGISLELATINNITYPNDIFPSDRFYETELSKNRIELAGPGYMLPSKTPGNAFIPDPDILKARTLIAVEIMA